MQNYCLENKLKLTKDELMRLDEILKKDKRTSLEDRLLRSEKESYSENMHSLPQYETGFFDLPLNSAAPESPHSRMVCDLDQSAFASHTAQQIDMYWDASQFAFTHAPVPVGVVGEQKQFQEVGLPRCSHLPVKMPNSAEFRIPNEYANFKEVLTRILEVEMQLNPNYRAYYAYLTIDQRFVPAGHSQRVKGAHVDGIPRNRHEPHRQRIDHCYIVCDSLPTKFYVHPFPQLKCCDLLQHDFCQVFDRVKDETKTLLTTPFVIYLMNAYSVHSAIDSDVDVIRTFLRLEFSTLSYDREGNSKNPYFDYYWEPRQCFRPSHLVLPDFIQ
jgi:hypothetical protein